MILAALKHFSERCRPAFPALKNLRNLIPGPKVVPETMRIFLEQAGNRFRPGKHSVTFLLIPARIRAWGCGAWLSFEKPGRTNGINI